MNPGAFAVLCAESVLSEALYGLGTCGRTFPNLPDIKPQYSLIGRFFSKFSGLIRVRPQLFGSTNSLLFAIVCWVTLGVENIMDGKSLKDKSSRLLAVT